MKYPYPRTDLTVRVSTDLHKQLRHMAVDLETTIQNVAAFALLQTCDAGESCQDWDALPDTLKQSLQN